MIESGEQVNEYYITAKVGAFVDARNMKEAKSFFKHKFLRGFPTVPFGQDYYLEFDEVKLLKKNIKNRD